jgi:hypothetical protein
MKDVTMNIKSLDGRFFEFKDIPWDELASQTTKELLKGIYGYKKYS